jgi:hypothetical protein
MWHDLMNENMGDRTADNFTGAGRSLLVETERVGGWVGRCSHRGRVSSDPVPLV